MASIAKPNEDQPPQRPASAARDSRFFAWLAAALVTATLLAFSTTYFVPVAMGRFTGEPILHVHGVLFLCWPVLLLAQSLTSARSRRWHRTLGLTGISLATAMVITGLLAIGSSIRTWTARGVGLEGQMISVIAFTGILLFAALVVAALRATRDRATHSRYMFIATLAMMQGASGRLALTAALKGNPAFLRPGLLPPPASMMPATVVHLLFDLAFLAILVSYDCRSSSRIHRATLTGGVALVAVILARQFFAETSLWMSIAGWLAAL